MRFSVMDIIKRNQIRINELAAGSPKLANQTLALDWKELQLALEECVFNQNLSTNLSLIKNFQERIKMIKNQTKILDRNKTPKALELIYDKFAR